MARFGVSLSLSFPVSFLLTAVTSSQELVISILPSGRFASRLFDTINIANGQCGFR
jgi:hypothetical protein